MRKFGLLFKAAMLNAYGNSGARDSRERKKSAGKAALFVILGIYILVILFIYFFGFSSLLQISGRLDAMIPLSISICSAMAIITTILHSHGYVYGCRDFELLSAMPLSSRTIFLSKFLFLYLECTIISAIVAIPCIVCYGIFAAPPVWFYFIMLFMLLTAPAIGVAIGGLIAFLTSFITISSGAKNKLLLVFNLLLVLGVMYLSLSIMPSAMSGDSLEATIDTIVDVANLHPLSGLMVSAAGGNILSLLLFTAINLLALTAITFVAGGRFTALNSKMGETLLRSDYQGKAERSSKPLIALYKREMSAYFSQYLYVINTAFGFIMLLLAAAALLLARSTVLDYVAAMGQNNIIKLLPVALVFLVSLTNTPACSISLEGQSFWISRTLPVDAKTLFLSKQLVWWTISVPATVIAVAAACFVLGLPVLYSVTLLCLLLLIILAGGLLGLTFDLSKPKLNWTNPASVVKQGAPTLYCMLVSMAYTGLSAMVLMLLPISPVVSMACLCLPPAVTAIVLWRTLSKKGDAKLLAIEN